LSAIEAGMSGLATLVKLAGRRADEAAAAWQRLDAQCADAKHKLMLLEQHRDAYRALTHHSLRDGMPAGSISARIGFIGQIEAILVRQTQELERLEAACARQWQAMLDARRDRRSYELLAERGAARAATAASLHSRRETDEALLRAAQAGASIFDANPPDE
jgi:flagellar export protein FliJ